MDYKTTGLLKISIEGKICGLETQIIEHIYRWSDTEIHDDIEYITEKIIKAIKKLDSFETISFVLTNGDYYDTKILAAIRFERKREYKKLEYVEGRYHEVAEYEDNSKAFMKEVKKSLRKMYDELNRIHTKELQKMLKEANNIPA